MSESLVKYEAIVERVKEFVCTECGMVDVGQTGEYPCPKCGLPSVWDEGADNMGQFAIAAFVEASLRIVPQLLAESAAGTEG